MALAYTISSFFQGFYTLGAFNAYSYGRQLHFCRDVKFSHFPYCNSLPQPHVSNAPHVNHPFTSPKYLIIVIMNRMEEQGCQFLGMAPRSWSLPSVKLKRVVEVSCYVQRVTKSRTEGGPWSKEVGWRTLFRSVLFWSLLWGQTRRHNQFFIGPSLPLFSLFLSFQQLTVIM